MRASYAGVNVISSRSFTRPAMIRLELDGGGRRRGMGEHSPTLTPLLVFDRRLPPWYKFLTLLSLPMPLKSKMATIISLRKY